MEEKHEVNHAFCLYPKVRFESQMPNEQVILVLRAHPITQLPWLFNTFILFIVLVGLNFILPRLFSVNQVIYFNIAGIVVILSYIWFNFLNWFFNVGVITNMRIVDIDFHNVLYKEVNATLLSKVEEVTSKSGGYIGSLFNFGNVYVETASSQIDIEFDKVPHPSRVVEIINSLLP